jgi:nitrogen PTS system EIIA component
MRIIDFLAPTAIITELVGSTAEDVLAELCRPIAATTRIDTQRLVEELQNRERLGSTGLGDGLAIPHAKVAGLRELVAGFGRSKAGIEFKAPDSRPTTLFFVLFAPTGGQARQGLHLNALARISRVFKSPTFRESLLNAKDAAEILRLIKAEDKD